MGATASTGTLVLVAIVGGLGAFLGAAVGQLVQLYRDKRQHERELELRAHDADVALVNERAQRREARYVPMMVDLAVLKRQLKETLILLDLYVTRREDIRTGNAAWANIATRVAQTVADRGVALWERTDEQREKMTTAHVETMAVASPEVRLALAEVIDWTGLFFWDLALQEGDEVGIVGNDDRPTTVGTLREFQAAVEDDLSAFVALIDAADAAMLADLRLG